MDVFLRCLQEGPLDSTHPLFFLSLERTAVRICENLRKFLSMILRQIQHKVLISERSRISCLVDFQLYSVVGYELVCI